MECEVFGQLLTYRLRQGVVSQRSFHLKLPHDSSHLLLGHPIQSDDFRIQGEENDLDMTLLTNILTLCLGLRYNFLVSTNFLQSSLDEMVQTETLPILQVLHHQVSKPGHMA